MHTTGSVTISARFNGPRSSGNGGYSCGVLAAHLDAAIARVRLHSPPPLDIAMTVCRREDGPVEMYHGDTLIGTAFAAQLDSDMPSPPDMEAAQRGQAAYPCYDEHLYPTCFVCGPGRAHADGLQIYPGPVNDWSLLACTWRPGSDLLDAAGHVKPEFVWSALDCPGSFAAMGPNMAPALLGELTAELLAPVPGNEALVVFAWPVGREGRKFYGGVAVASAAGEVLARSLTTWIQLRS